MKASESPGHLGGEVRPLCCDIGVKMALEVTGLISHCDDCNIFGGIVTILLSPLSDHGFIHNNKSFVNQWTRLTNILASEKSTGGKLAIIADFGT